MCVCVCVCVCVLCVCVGVCVLPLSHSFPFPFPFPFPSPSPATLTGRLDTCCNSGVANSGDKAALVRLAVGSKAKFDLASVETVELGVSPCDRTFSGAVDEKVFVVAGGCNGELLTIYQAQ